jgi:hypothetical protein
MKALILALGLVAFGLTTATAASQPDEKTIVGTWMFSSRYRPERIIVFHANGKWGVKKLEEGPEDIRGRRWRVEGNTLVLSYPSDHGFDTARYKIISFTRGEFVTQIHGDYESTYTRMH